jgi:hypothetical protein
MQDEDSEPWQNRSCEAKIDIWRALGQYQPYQNDPNARLPILSSLVILVVRGRGFVSESVGEVGGNLGNRLQSPHQGIVLSSLVIGALGDASVLDRRHAFLELVQTGVVCHQSRLQDNHVAAEGFHVVSKLLEMGVNDTELLGKDRVDHVDDVS